MNRNTPDPITWIMNRVVDFIEWLFPGRLGKALGFLVAWLLFLGLLYEANKDAIQKWIG
jgi:hypothetical protein